MAYHQNTTYGPYGKGMHFFQGYSLFWRDIKEKYPEILEGTSGMFRALYIVEMAPLVKTAPE